MQPIRYATIAQSQQRDQPSYNDLYTAVNNGAFAALIVVIAGGFLGYRFLNRLVDRLIAAPWIASIPERLDDIEVIPDQIKAIEIRVQELQEQVTDLLESDRDKAQKMNDHLTQILHAIDQIKERSHAK
jgi:methyl-accepting chemotaxis protein